MCITIYLDWKCNTNNRKCIPNSWIVQIEFSLCGVGYEHPTNTKLNSNQEICTVFDCEKPSIYAGFRLITITLLRPKTERAVNRLFLFFRNFEDLNHDYKPEQVFCSGLIFVYLTCQKNIKTSYLSHLSERALIWSVNFAKSLFAPPRLCSITRSRRFPACSSRWNTAFAR